MLTGYLLSLLAAAASVQAAQQAGVLAGGFTDNITVSATNLVQCAQAAISWTGGRAPYTLTIGTGGYYIGVNTLETHGSIDSNSYNDYTVTQKAGTDMFFMIEEAGGGRGYIQNLPVQAGDSGCLGEASSSASSASSSPSSSRAAARPASSLSSANSSSSSSSSSSSTAPSSSSSAAPSSSSSPSSTSTKSAGVVIVTETASTSTTSSASATSVSSSASASAPTTLSAAGTSTITVPAPSLRSTTSAAASAASAAAASTLPNSGANSLRSSVVSLACGLAAFLVL